MTVVRGRPRGRTWLLILATVASIAAAALTLLIPDVLNGPPVMNGSAFGTALIMLSVGVPVLLVSFWLERRGSRWAHIARLGSLAYLAYNSFLLLFASPFNSLFLVYVVAMSSVAFALGASFFDVDRSAVEERLSPGRARIVGGYIWLIVAFNTMAWLRTVIPAIMAADPTSFLDGTGIATNPIFVQDLVFWLPSAAVIGWLVWGRRPWGVVLAGSYLVYGLIESIGVATDQWFGSSADPTSTIATMDAVTLFAVLAVVGVGMLSFFAISRPGRSSIEQRAGRATAATTH